jgi:hypothetical protein
MTFEATFEIEKDSKKITLTAAEARDLFNKLKQHFGDVTPITYPIFPAPPAPQPPFIPWSIPGTGTQPPFQPWTITCSYDNAANSSS